MYEPGTILTLKEPKDPDPETNEEFPYNRVRVAAPSPVGHTNKGDWTGPDAAGVILIPLTNYGGNLDEPYGKVRELFDVESVPETEVEVKQTVRVISPAQQGPTPEEVFAKEAPGTPSENGERVRTSPLGEPGGPKGADPLG